MQKYFIAIIPPEPLLTEVQRVKESISEEYETKGALMSPGHITLHMPFSWDEEKESKLISALDNFHFHSPFSVTLNNYNCFEPRVIFIDVLQNLNLNMFQANLVCHVKKHLHIYNQSDDRRGFHPHITVAFRDLKKPNFYNIWRAYQDKKFEKEFVCSSFSLLKFSKSRWDIFKTFPFQ